MHLPTLYSCAILLSVFVIRSRIMSFFKSINDGCAQNQLEVLPPHHQQLCLPHHQLTISFALITCLNAAIKFLPASLNSRCCNACICFVLFGVFGRKRGALGGGVFCYFHNHQFVCWAFLFAFFFFIFSLHSFMSYRLSSFLLNLLYL